MSLTSYERASGTNWEARCFSLESSSIKDIGSGRLLESNGDSRFTKGSNVDVIVGAYLDVNQ